MRPDEARELVKYLAGLFTQPLTQDQARFLSDRFLSMDAAAVRAAIDAHRASHEFVTYPQLLEGCRAAQHDAEAAGVDSRKEGSWADVHRRQNPQLARANDLEVCLRVHRGWWHRCSRSDGYRRGFTESCRNVLVAQKMPPGEAERWAEAVFAEDPAYFRQVLQEARDRPEAAEAGEAAAEESLSPFSEGVV